MHLFVTKTDMSGTLEDQNKRKAYLDHRLHGNEWLRALAVTSLFVIWLNYCIFTHGMIPVDRSVSKLEPEVEFQQIFEFDLEDISPPPIKILLPNLISIG